jgi:hypothetical protein
LVWGDVDRLLLELHLLPFQAQDFSLWSFHNEFALVLRNLGSKEYRKDYIDLALIEYSAAAHHFEKAGHIRYQACVENNLAFLFWKVQRLADAHKHLDRAQILFAKLRDDVHTAQVDETRARVLLAEDRVVEAEKPLDVQFGHSNRVMKSRCWRKR